MKGRSKFGSAFTESSRQVKGCKEAEPNTSRSRSLKAFLLKQVGCDGFARYSV